MGKEEVIQALESIVESMKTVLDEATAKEQRLEAGWSQKAS